MRAALGVTLLLAPGRVFELASGRAASRGQARVVRILGARHLMEVAGLSVRPQADGIVRRVDLAHAASMVGLAICSPTYRRPALVSAAVAIGVAGRLSR